MKTIESKSMNIYIFPVDISAAQLLHVDGSGKATKDGDGKIFSENVSETDLEGAS